MKMRLGFVSNSSSSSFAVMRKAVSLDQYEHLMNHIEYARKIKWDNDGYSGFRDGDRWDIVLGKKTVKCSTYMDNFDLLKYAVEVLLISEDAIVDYDHSDPDRY